MTGTTLHDSLVALVTPSLEGLGYRLVQVRLMESGRRTLQIMAERQDNLFMTVEDCATISHQLSALLDVEDLVKGAYALEISSPGIDRPLITRADFERHVGFEIKCESKLPVEGRKRFKGRLERVEGDAVIMQTEQGQRITLAFSMLQHAKLLLTDELLAIHAKEATRQQALSEPVPSGSA